MLAITVALLQSAQLNLLWDWEFIIRAAAAIGLLTGIVFPIVRALVILIKSLTGFFCGLDAKLNILIKSHSEFLEKFELYLARTADKDGELNP